MLFNVFPLVNTCHALGFSAFLMLDALTFFRCQLGKMVHSSNFWNSKCSIGVLAQIGVFLRVGF